MTSTLQIPTAKVFEPLLHPARYKGAFGGRGSGKSHFFAGLMIEDCIREPGLSCVCIREVQKTLKDSAKKLLEKKLQAMGLGQREGFKIWKELIETPGDGSIIFQGMQDHNAESIKSLEGINRAWVEEAQTLSTVSLRLLKPTIRAEESEIWFSWNPRRKTDPVDMLMRQGSTPTGAQVVRANWNNNPWLPAVLEQERIDCLRDEPDDYDHVWDGGYATVTKGAYFAKHIATARGEGRLGVQSYDPLMTLKVFIDIGGTGSKSDAFSMWVVQFVGQQIIVLDYYEAQGQDCATHVEWLREKGYTPDKANIWLPHDGGTNDRVHDVSYESAFKSVGYQVEVVPNQGKGAASARIEEVRRLFPKIWIDGVKCEGGIEALGWYHEKIDEVRNIGLGPDHDWASHAADAFGLMCIVYKPPVVGGGLKIPVSSGGWMRA